MINNSGEVWLLRDGGYLYIEPSVMNSLVRYGQEDYQKEAGGCLLGFYRGQHIHIAMCTQPMGGDRRKKFRFDRRDPDHVNIAIEQYKTSGSKCTYLGDWHSHPEAVPSPSLIDYEEWDKVTKLKKAWPTVSIIVGRVEFWVGVGSASRRIRDKLQKPVCAIGVGPK